MRKLSNKELTNGIFVQCFSFGKLSPIIYQILIRENRGIIECLYKEKDSNWEMPGNLVEDIWYETELTKALNREEKLNELGI